MEFNIFILHFISSSVILVDIQTGTMTTFLMLDMHMSRQSDS